MLEGVVGRNQVIYIQVTHQDVDLTQNTYSNGNTTDRDVDLSTIARSGIFSLQVEIESASTSTSVTITYYMSNDGVNWVAGASAIVTAVDVSSGLDQIYSFEPKLCKWLRIRVTENNTGTVVDCTCTLAVA